MNSERKEERKKEKERAGEEESHKRRPVCGEQTSSSHRTLRETIQQRRVRSVPSPRPYCVLLSRWPLQGRGHRCKEKEEGEGKRYGQRGFFDGEGEEEKWNGRTDDRGPVYLFLALT